MSRAALLALLAFTACVGTPDFAAQMNLAARAYLAAKGTTKNGLIPATGYLGALEADNEQVSACYLAHPNLAGDAARAACPPLISPAVRSQALFIITEADTAMRLLAAAPAPITRPQIEALGNLQAAALELPLLVAGEVK